MTALRSRSQTLARRLLLLPAVLLLFGLAAASTHHHAGGGESRACALCTLSHTPAVPTAAAPLPTPAPAARPVGIATPDAPCVLRSSPRASRAPPVR